MWTVPADRMKMRRPHRVPLCDRCVELLREAGDLLDGTNLVFPGSRHDKPLSDMTLSKLVKKLGFHSDIHAFRTWGQQQTDFPEKFGTRQRAIR